MVGAVVNFNLVCRDSSSFFLALLSPPSEDIYKRIISPYSLVFLTCFLYVYPPLCHMYSILIRIFSVRHEIYTSIL